MDKEIFNILLESAWKSCFTIAIIILLIMLLIETYKK
jgi:hypothetical protein